jgi:predicted small metal-binding protein
MVVSKRLDCPMEGCHASIEGESGAEIMAQAEAHAATAHPELTLDEETAASIRSKIVEV